LDVVVLATFTTVSSLFTYMYGAWDEPLKALVFIVTLDIITGVVSAWKRGKLDARTWHEGIPSKVGIFAVVALANVVGRLLGLINPPVLRTTIVWAYFGAEGLSAAENICEMGTWVPEWLKELLTKLRNSKPMDNGGGGGKSGTVGG
jgi:toxin secretion/phage lysis holin